MSTQSLQAGIARRDITPPLGTELFGYPTQRFATVVDDNLAATALVLQHENTRVALITLDLCIVDESEIAHIRAEISKETGIPPEAITIIATHTHSGPITVRAWGWGAKNQEYLDSIRPLLVEAVAQALSTQSPVKIGIGVTQTQTGINRRGTDVNGNVGLSSYEFGVFDPDLTVMRFESENGTVASLVHLSAHPTARGKVPEISRDWPGVMVDRVEKVTGAPVLFINGSFGDVAPRSNVGGAVGDGAPASTEVGLNAATDALRAWKSIKDFRESDLQTFTQNFSLPHAPLPSLEVTEGKVKEFAGCKNARGRDECEHRHWNAVRKALGKPVQESRDWQQTLTRIGPLVVVPFAGEIFTEIAQRVKYHSPFEYTLCAGTTNGSHGYYVTRESRVRGGYEPWVAKAYGAYVLADNIDDVLVQKNVALLNELKSRTI